MPRDLFVTPPSQLDWDDMQAFLDQGLPEGERIEYKRDLNDRVPQAIVAMANTGGGIILVGIDEDPTTIWPARAHWASPRESHRGEAG